MATIKYRADTNGVTGKGEPLTNAEVDGNFASLDNAKLEFSTDYGTQNHLVITFGQDSSVPADNGATVSRGLVFQHQAPEFSEHPSANWLCYAGSGVLVGGDYATSGQSVLQFSLNRVDLDSRNNVFRSVSKVVMELISPVARRTNNAARFHGNVELRPLAAGTRFNQAESDQTLPNAALILPYTAGIRVHSSTANNNPSIRFLQRVNTGRLLMTSDDAAVQTLYATVNCLMGVSARVDYPNSIAASYYPAVIEATGEASFVGGLHIGGTQHGGGDDYDTFVRKGEHSLRIYASGTDKWVNSTTINNEGNTPDDVGFIELNAFNVAEAETARLTKAINVRAPAAPTTGVNGDVFTVFGDGAVISKNIFQSAGQTLTSDRRLKTDIVPAGDQWKDIQMLDIVEYRWKRDPEGDKLTGVIAQDVEAAGLKGVVTDGPSKAVHTDVLLFKAIKALQEAMDKIEVLEEKVEVLEEQVAELQVRE